MNELFKENYKFETYQSDFPLEEDKVSLVSSWMPESLSSAAPNRKEEYLAGRYCALKACEKLGIVLSELNRAEDRSPIWPKNIVGSISHTGNQAMCIVGLSRNIKSIGIDIESIISEKRFDSIERMVLTDNDKSYISHLSDHKKDFVYTLIFSAKEALFKLIHPLCKCYFDFREADIIDIDFNNNQLQLAIISQRDEMQDYLKTYQGYFHQEDSTIYCYFALST